MTTHPVPVGTGQWQSSEPEPTTGREQLRSAARRLNQAHASDALGQPLDAASVDGDPHDRPALTRRQAGAALARTEAISAIHALALFIEESGDLPIPELVRAHHYVKDVLELETLAERLGCSIYGPDDRPQFSHTLSLDNNCWVQIIVAVKPADRPL